MENIYLPSFNRPGEINQYAQTILRKKIRDGKYIPT